MTEAGAVLPLVDYLKLIGMSMLPVWELRGTIPIAYSVFNMPIWNAYFLALVGSSIPVPFILLFIKAIIHWMQKSKIKLFRKVADFLMGKVDKNKDKIQKYAYWALLPFVAVPLPGTGVWTGSLLAAMLDLKMKKALPVILAGNAIAGLIVVAVTLGVGSVVS